MSEKKVIEEKIMAKVNGREITLDDVQLFINSLRSDLRSQFNDEESLQRVAQELVHQELMYLDALDRNLEADETFQKELEIAKESLLKQYAMALLMRQVQPTEEEAKEYYESHKEHFICADAITASHILVPTEEEAVAVKERIFAGEAFEEVAKELSQCPSKEQGGSLGTFDPNQMVPEFAKAAYELELGVVSDPVQTQFGYHIIRVDNRTAAEPMPYEEVKKEAMHQLTAKLQQDLYLKTTEELGKKYTVEKFF